MSAMQNKKKSKATSKFSAKAKVTPRAKSSLGAKAAMRSGNFLDTIEDVAGYLPGAIRGIRGVLGRPRAAKAEAAFATPASFAMVSNNVTQLSGPSAVTHPRLGIAGQSVKFSQPLGTVRPGIVGGLPQFFSVTEGPATVAPDGFTILINPNSLGGPLAFEAARFERFTFRHLRVKFITYQTTTFVGTGALAIESDVGNLVATSFQTLRMIVPSVTFPYRIPEAVLEWVNGSDELYYCADADGSTGGASERQTYQAAIRGFDAAVGGVGPDGTCGFLEIDGVVEFYDPIPPQAIMPANLKERLAVSAVLKALRPVVTPVLPRGQSQQDREWIALLTAAAAQPPEDLGSGGGEAGAEQKELNRLQDALARAQLALSPVSTAPAARASPPKG